MNAPIDPALRAADAAHDVTPELVERTLERIVASESFRRSRRHQRLLRYMVERTLAGDFGALKETVLACEVFGYSIDRFDPTRDTIVRVEARRLRQRLARYFEGAGRDDPLEIGLPVGSYVPMLRTRRAARVVESDEARALVERGYQSLREGGETALARALEHFESAIRLAPDHAPAYLGAARVWNNFAGELLRPPMPSIDHAWEALQTSLQLDPSQPEALTLLAAVLHRYHFNWAEAQPLFKRAIRQAPELAFAHMGYGAHLRLQGLMEDAERELQQARRLDPHYLGARWQMVLLWITQRRYGMARTELAALVNLIPDYVPAQHLEAFLDLLEGQPKRALERYRAIDRVAPAQTIGLAGIAQASAMLGDDAGAQAALDALAERFAGQYVSPCQLALIELRRGRIEQVIAHLEDAASLRDSNVIFIHSDPSYDVVRGDPRFQSLLARHRRPGGG